MENSETKIKVPTTGVSDFPKLIQEGKGKYVDKSVTSRGDKSGTSRVAFCKNNVNSCRPSA